MRSALRLLPALSLLGGLLISVAVAADETATDDPPRNHLLLTTQAIDDWSAARQDLDGDDHRDLVIGLPAARHDRGRVVILFGPERSWPTTLDLDRPQPVRHIIIDGEWPGDRFGESLSVVEGASERLSTLLIGAPGARSPIDEFGSGAVYLLDADSLSEPQHMGLELASWSQSLRPRHHQHASNGSKRYLLDPQRELQAIATDNTRLRGLDYAPTGPVAPAPEINLGEGIEDQFVLAGEPLNLDFLVTDELDPASKLTVEVDFNTAAQIFDPISVALSGNDQIRTLTLDTLTGNPDGSEPLVVRVFNTSDAFAEAPFDLFVLNGSVPEINDGLGLTDEVITAGQTLVKPFRVTDLLFNEEILNYAATSSNTALVANADIVLDGDGPDRTLQISTTAGPGGQTTISVIVSNPLDATEQADFVLTIEPTGGGPPQINQGNGIAPQTILAGQVLNLAFQVSDPVEPAQNLTVTAASDNQTLLPDSNLQLFGTGNNRSLQIQAPSDSVGSVPITLVVTNSQELSSTASFPLTILSRTAPQINFGQGVPDLTARPGDLVEWTVTVSDTFDPPSNLTLLAQSLTPELVLDEWLQLFGSTGTRLLRIALPTDAQPGLAQLRLILFNSAGLSTASDFVLAIEAPEGPVINDGLPLPDIELVPGQPALIEFTVEPVEGQPGPVLLEAFSTDQEVLPDAALELISDGTDWTLTVDSTLARPGSTIVVIRALGPNGAVSEVTFELSFPDLPTELALDSRPLGLSIGQQRFAEIDLINSGSQPAFDLELDLSSAAGPQLISTLSRASECQISPEQSVGCIDLQGAAWECLGDERTRLCRLARLDPGQRATLVLGVLPDASGSVTIEARASNAPAIAGSVQPEN